MAQDPDVKKFLTPIRALQLVSKLLKENDEATHTMQGMLGDPSNPTSYAAAIGMVRDIAAKFTVTGMFVPPIVSKKK